MHVELLIAKPISEATVGMVDDFRSQNHLVEDRRTLPVADRDDAVIDPDFWVGQAQTYCVSVRVGTSDDTAPRIHAEPPPSRTHDTAGA